MTDQDWISTGKAAKLLGYNPDHFVRKFEGIIPMRRSEGGHRRWLASAVHQAAGFPSNMQQAG